MTKPKFKEITIQVPFSFRWIAVDSDGEINAFQKKPIVSSNYHGYWMCGNWRRNNGCIGVGKGPIPKDFTKTLERI